MALTTKTTQQQQLLADLGICIIIALWHYLLREACRSAAQARRFGMPRP